MITTEHLIRRALYAPRSVIGLCEFTGRPQETIERALAALVRKGRARLGADGWRYEFVPYQAPPWAPEHERTLIVMLEEGASIRQIGRTIRRSPNTVRRRIDRAIRAAR